MRGIGNMSIDMMPTEMARELKILYVDTEKIWRGGQEQLFGLMTGMKRRGHAICLAAPKRSALFQKAFKAGIGVFDFRQRQELSPAALFRLWSLGKEGRFDVVHSNTPRSIVMAGLAARLARVPAVFCSRRVVFPLRSRLSPLKYNWTTDRILTVSSSIRETLAKAGVKPSMIEVVYEGVDLAWIDRQHTEPITQPGQAPIVGTVAHMSPEKGHTDLLDAIVRLRAEFPRAHFYLVGDGHQKATLMERTIRLGIQDRVTFTGFRTDSEALMTQFDIFCLPSLSEGLSSAILAAMASRLPVVSTSVGGIPELVLDGVTGFLVPPRDSARLAVTLAKLLEDSDLRRKMGQAGRQRIEQQFTVQQKLDATENSYRQLLLAKGIR